MGDAGGLSPAVGVTMQVGDALACQEDVRIGMHGSSWMSSGEG